MKRHFPIFTMKSVNLQLLRYKKSLANCSHSVNILIIPSENYAYLKQLGIYYFTKKGVLRNGSNQRRTQGNRLESN